ncbi:MAG TPA: response regulator transcription factor [Rhizomicrobium sp.]|jgi:two-component system OmpR family response regulator|nr:response regulator transcription factor [Rhizomicrobium sp.]
MTKHVTIIEDDPDVRALLARSLGADGYQVTALESGVGIEDAITSNHIDLVILDIGLPDMDGLTIMRKIRRNSDVAIIIVSGRGDLADRVVGLEIGADDYITKPFEPREILARVRSVLRRGRHQGDAAAAPAGTHLLYEFGDWRLDATAQALHGAGGHSVTLTSGEFRLLEAMVTRANRVLTRDQLMDVCYGNNSPAFDRSIDVCVGRLRRKLLDDPRNPSIIRTVRNGGYIFAARVTQH